jgi:hypothetical protein
MGKSTIYIYVRNVEAASSPAQRQTFTGYVGMTHPSYHGGTASKRSPFQDAKPKNEAPLLGSKQQFAFFKSAFL